MFEEGHLLGLCGYLVFWEGVVLEEVQHKAMDLWVVHDRRVIERKFCEVNHLIELCFMDSDRSVTALIIREDVMRDPTRRIDERALLGPCDHTKGTQGER